MIPITHFLFISVALFSIGLYAVLSQKNLIRVLIGVELMVNAAIINFVAFGRAEDAENEGQMMAIFAMVLAAAGAAVALVIILKVYAQYTSINPKEMDELKH